jgi:hypothetical protein
MVRTSVLLSISSAVSKGISLLRDVAILAALGIGRRSDTLQLALAIGGGISGVVGSALGLALVPEIASHHGRLAPFARGVVRIVPVAMVLTLPVAAVGAVKGSAPWVGGIVVFAGAFDGIAMAVILAMQGVGEFRTPSVLLGFSGLVTSCSIGALLVIQAVSLELVALSVLADSVLITSLLVLHIRKVVARQPVEDASIRWGLVLRGWSANSSSYFLIGAAQVSQRLLAARVPGGATVFVLAHRLASVLNGLILQPFHFLIFPKLASRDQQRAAGRATVRFSVAFGRVTLLLLLPTMLLWPFVGGQLTGGAGSRLLREGSLSLALLAVSLSFCHLTAVAIRDWLVRGRAEPVITGYALYACINAASLATPFAGPLAAAIAELLAQGAQSSFSLVRNRFIGAAYCEAMRTLQRRPWISMEASMAVVALVGVVLPGPIWIKAIPCAAWTSVVLFGHTNPKLRLRQLVSDLWPAESQPDHR